MIRGLGIVYYNAREYDRAIEKLNTALEFNPDSSPAYRMLFLAYNKKKMYRESINALVRYLGLVGSGDHATIIEETYSESGYDEAIRRVVDLPLIVPFIKALIYSLFGERELALECIEKAYEDRSPWIWWLMQEPAFDSLRSDSRYQALLKKMGLAE